MDEELHSMDVELFSTWAAKVGEVAFRKLWAMANAEDATPQQRERLFTWFAEMAIGKPRTMETTPGGAAASGCGVIILPAVEIDP